MRVAICASALIARSDSTSSSWAVHWRGRSSTAHIEPSSSPSGERTGMPAYATMLGASTTLPASTR